MEKQTKKGDSPVNFNIFFLLVVRLASVWAHSPVLIGSIPINNFIHMAELVDALDLKSSSFQSVSSTLAVNIFQQTEVMIEWLICAIVNRVRKHRVFESHSPQLYFYTKSN